MLQLSTDSALSWWAGIGGTAGVVAFGGAIYKLGGFANRVQTLERAVETRASKESVTSMQDTLDAMQRGIDQIRDILMNERRR